MGDLLPWAPAYLLGGLAAIWGRTTGRQWFFWLGKPLPVAVLLWVVVGDPTFRPLLVAALGCSWLGDVLLMLPKRYFAAGLASFLAGLCAYVVHFSAGVPCAPSSLLFAVAPIVVAAAVVTRLWPHLGRLRIPVLVYVAALVTLVWRMLTRTEAPLGLAAQLWGVAGGLLFLLADSLLALRRFAGRPVPYPLELGTYYLAQWCLVSAALG